MTTNTSQNSTFLKCFVTIPLLKYFSCTVGVFAYSANVPCIKIIISITVEKKRQQQRVENAAFVNA